MIVDIQFLSTKECTHGSSLLLSDILEHLIQCTSSYEFCLECRHIMICIQIYRFSANTLSSSALSSSDIPHHILSHHEVISVCCFGLPIHLSSIVSIISNHFVPSIFFMSMRISIGCALSFAISFKVSSSTFIRERQFVSISCFVTGVYHAFSSKSLHNATHFRGLQFGFAVSHF